MTIASATETMNAIQHNQYRDEKTLARWRENEATKKMLEQLQRGNREIKPSDRVRAILTQYTTHLTLSPTATEADWAAWLASYEQRPAAEGVRRCVECGAVMREREGKFGAFWGCEKYPKCKYTENE